MQIAATLNSLQLIKRFITSAIFASRPHCNALELVFIRGCPPGYGVLARCAKKIVALPSTANPSGCMKISYQRNILDLPFPDGQRSQLKRFCLCRYTAFADHEVVCAWGTDLR